MGGRATSEIGLNFVFEKPNCWFSHGFVRLGNPIFDLKFKAELT